ncbi:MAG: trigger factor [Candidatus Liberibacter europaeus]|uniref:Trigger factor n=1 Tax=Candidatus Liberibacter europaeus TaxID=744859 RepID=A0A2T4VWS0_9HYPH|nr:MAG: trigger factor [Candidatus Liberibacter europaeus]
MQVVENVSEGLKRELDVVMSSDQLMSSFSSRLEEIRSKANLKGFRPGKVPASHIKSIYGKSILSEIIDAIVKEKIPDVISQRNERAVASPKITINDGSKEAMSLLLEGSEDLKLHLSYEVVPEVEIHPLDDLTIIREVCEIDEKSIDDHMLEIAENNRLFEPKEEASAVGDRVKMDYNLTLDGLIMNDYSKKDFQFILGSDEIFPGTSDAFIGIKSGENKEIEICFPDDYSVKDLAGKKAILNYSVKEVARSLPIVVNDDLAVRLGFKSEKDMRDQVSNQIRRKSEMIAQYKIKRQILDYLDNKYKFDVPESLVNNEYRNILQQVNAEINSSGQNVEDSDILKEEDLQDYMMLANRRVRSGMVLGKIGESQNIQVTEDEIKSALSQQLRSFPGREKQIIDYFQKTPNAINTLSAPIFEEKVINYILENVEIKDRKVTMSYLLSHPHELCDDTSQDESS